jgi:hypothetical protein
MDNYKRSRSILEENRAILVQMAEELLIREVLDGEQVKRIVSGLPLDENRSSTNPTAASTSAGGTEDKEKQPSTTPQIPPLNKPLPQE